jgi:hypothetical protein
MINIHIKELALCNAAERTFVEVFRQHYKIKKRNPVVPLPILTNPAISE